MEAVTSVLNFMLKALGRKSKRFEITEAPIQGCFFGEL